MAKSLRKVWVSHIAFRDGNSANTFAKNLIEIAKIMSTDDSSAFVNGILDSFYNDWTSKKEEAN